MKFIVDKINPEECPFFIDADWVDEEWDESEIIPNVYFQGNRCLLDSYHLCRKEIWFGGCQAKKEECPFCITYDEFKRRMGQTPNKNKEEK